jgi:ABC-type ATPase with predicted acetyltransferase domain
LGIRELFKITRVASRYDSATGKFIINISYETKTDVTDRTISVAEAFGLGIDQFQQHVLYDNVTLKIAPRDIVYITGESGSGKSALLRELQHELATDTINIANVAVDPSKPLIESVGRTFEEALELLSRVGLNDAFLFVRRFEQLSDGQKYRFRLAKVIESDKQYWVADEFCATLDRDTAKIVAFNVQKLARQLGKAVLVATTHTDLFRDLKPSVHIHKRFGKEIRVQYFQDKLNTSCSLTKEMRIVEGTRNDYEKLACFHYRSSRLPPPYKIFTLKHRNQKVGVIVYSYPPAMCFGRRQALGRVAPLSELNKNLVWISRVVLHPKYRTIGLGTLLVKGTLPLIDRRYVETIAVMAKYNPFFEKAGMTKIAERKPHKSILKAVEQLQKLGFNPVFLASKQMNQQKLESVNLKQVAEVKQALLSVSNIYYKRLASAGQAFLTRADFEKTLKSTTLEKLAQMLSALSVLTQTKVYLFWKNPYDLG